ncbi:MAG: calcium/sodium antiporter [Bacteroidota bacterium]
MSLLQSLAFMIGGFALLLVGAEALVRGASALALRFGLSPLVVGLTVVAFGTSSPELVICIAAALSGDGGIALGNVVGSNIANLALIVGVAAAIAPLAIERQLIRIDMPVVLASSLLMVAFLLDGSVERWEGAVLTVGIVVYVWYSIWQSRREAAAHRAAREAVADNPDAPIAEDLPVSFGSSIWRDLLFVAVGLVGLVIGGRLLLEGAESAARGFGVSEAVIGLTLVALGTSLPELATTVVAAMRGQGTMALGNAVGSNVFNVLGVLGPTALIQPVASDGVGVDSLAVMIGVTLLVHLTMATQRTMARWEGALLISVYVSYVVWLVI